MPVNTTDPYFGNGSDLDVIWNNVTNVQLGKDMYYRSITVIGTVVVSTNGWQVYCSGLTAIDPLGSLTFRCNGNNASGQTGGAAIATGSLPKGQAGGNGGAVAGNGVDGVRGDVSTSGAGGIVTGGATGGAGATSGLLGAANNPFYSIRPSQGLATNSQTNATLRAGSGGGGGAGAPTISAGGGGGGGGGSIALYLSQLSGALVVEAKGGNGAAGTGNNAAGGGAGGGGYGLVVTNSANPNITYTLTPGTPGASGGGNGQAGAAGGTGLGVTYSVAQARVYFAGVADARWVTDGSITSGSNQLNSASAGFTASDVGKLVGVVGAGSSVVNSSNILVATINSVSAGVATLSASASQTVTAATVAFGTDNSTLFGNQLAVAQSNQAELYIPPGNYAFGSGITLPSYVTIRGCPQAVLVAIINNNQVPPQTKDPYCLFYATAKISLSDFGPLSQTTVLGDNKIISSGSGLANVVPGDYIRVTDNDTYFLLAYYRVVAKSGTAASWTFTVERPILFDIPAAAAGGANPFPVARVTQMPEQIRILGDGMIITGTCTRYVELAGVRDCTVRDIIFSPRAGGPTTMLAAYDLGSYRCSLERLTTDGRSWPPAANNLSTQGLALESCDHCQMIDCNIGNLQASASGGTALAMWDCAECSVINCHGHSSNIGLAIHTDSGPTLDRAYQNFGCRSCKVSGGSFDSNLENGIFVGTNSSYCDLSGFTANYNKRFGILIAGGAESPGTPMNNRFTNFETRLNGDTAVTGERANIRVGSGTSGTVFDTFDFSDWKVSSDAQGILIYASCTISNGFCRKTPTTAIRHVIGRALLRGVHIYQTAPDTPSRIIDQPPAMTASLTTTAGSNTVTAASAIFTKYDEGKVILLPGGGPGGSDLRSRILAFPPPPASQAFPRNTINIEVNASVSGVRANSVWASDDPLELDGCKLGLSGLVITAIKSDNPFGNIRISNTEIRPTALQNGEVGLDGVSGCTFTIGEGFSAEQCKKPIAVSSGVTYVFNNEGGLFGDGSDGDVVWSGSQSLARDWFCRTLKITGTNPVISMNGFQIFCQGPADFSGATGLVFAADGSPGAGQGGGAGGATGSLPSGGSGGAGGNASVAGTAGTQGDVSASGAGGNGGGGAAGGAGRSVTEGPRAPYRGLRATWQITNPVTGQPLRVGSGGAGGGGGSTGVGGGGGGGGGACVLWLLRVAGSFTMRANGGNGAAGTAPQGGGGGGGGGGWALLVTEQGSPQVTATLSGGSGGAGQGAGTAGAAGSTGLFVLIRV